MFSPELLSKITIWRQKQADGTITKSDLTEFVQLLRGERRSAIEASAKRRTRAKVETKSAEDLLKELE